MGTSHILAEEIACARQDEMPVENRNYIDETVTGADIHKVEFVAVKFERCRFVECDFTGAGFYQARLEKCDFSNCIFSGSYWKDTKIIECKGNGSRFDLAVFKKTGLQDTQLNMANFGQSLWESCFAQTCSFREAFFRR
uniref:pentapeptide repeat-containing protein n=1 Tax=Faecalicatena contorta TaxID=39482 RepID=UPI00359C7E1B